MSTSLNWCDHWGILLQVEAPVSMFNSNILSLICPGHIRAEIHLIALKQSNFLMWVLSRCAWTAWRSKTRIYFVLTRRTRKQWIISNCKSLRKCCVCGLLLIRLAYWWTWWFLTLFLFMATILPNGFRRTSSFITVSLNRWPLLIYFIFITYFYWIILRIFWIWLVAWSSFWPFTFILNKP